MPGCHLKWLERSWTLLWALSTPHLYFSWHLVGRQISNKCFLRLFSLKLTLLAVGKMSACCCLEFKICDYLVFGEPLKIVIVFKIRFAASLFPSGAGRAFPLCACCQQRVWIRRQCSVVGSVGSWMIPFFPVCVLFFRRGGNEKDNGVLKRFLKDTPPFLLSPVCVVLPRELFGR